MTLAGTPPTPLSVETLAPIVSLSGLSATAKLAVRADIVSVSSLTAVEAQKLAEGGPYIHEAGWRRRQRVPERIPVHAQTEPTVIEIELPDLEPVAESVAAIADLSIYAALFAAGAIDEEQYVALIAA